MGARALFSRSHLNISFRAIDLFCVTYQGPFFAIKKERGCDCGVEALSVVWQSRLVCMCV